jgi:hypothetical protein
MHGEYLTMTPSGHPSAWYLGRHTTPEKCPSFLSDFLGDNPLSVLTGPPTYLLICSEEIETPARRREVFEALLGSRGWRISDNPNTG